MHKKKTIILGVTGSIAAYKAADLCSKLKKQDYDVVVILTSNAQKMVGEPTFRSLSRNPVITDLFQIPDWVPGHVALSERADLFLVAPATVNIIAKMAQGICDDALSTAYITMRCPVLIAPAMNENMYHHPTTQANLKLLESRGVNIIGPATGDLACGVKGIGRMSEVVEILEVVNSILK